MTSSHLSVSQYGAFLQLMEQPILLPYPPTTFTQNALLVGAEVYLEVALLRCPVVAVGALKGLFPGVRSHMKRQDAVEAEAFPAQRTGVLPVFMVVFRRRVHLRGDAWIGDSEKLGELHSAVHTAKKPGVQDLIGQKRHLAPNWVGGWMG